MKEGRSHSTRERVRDRLRHVYWLGGGSGAGKSTVAATIASKYGFRIYDSDKAMAEHFTRIDREKSPCLQRFAEMSLDERWVHRTPRVMLETFHWFRGEGFEQIVDDLIELPGHPPVIAEGFRLLPGLVKPLLAASGRAVWLLPTPPLREAAFEKRRPAGAPWTFISETSNPEKALANLLERDRMFTDLLRDEAQLLGLRVVEIGLDTPEDDAAELVTAALGL